MAVGAFDFTLNRANWIVRGNADYGYLGDAAKISEAKINATASGSPAKKSRVGKNAVALGIEAGYDIFSQISKMRNSNQKMYLFGRYEYYDSYVPAKNQPEYAYTDKQRVAVGINYYPMPQIAVKAEYSHRFLKPAYNDEPSVSIGIAYQGFFM